MKNLNSTKQGLPLDGADDEYDKQMNIIFNKTDHEAPSCDSNNYWKTLQLMFSIQNYLPTELIYIESGTTMFRLPNPRIFLAIRAALKGQQI